MGWSDCGEDSRGRPIGYAFEATCDHPDCEAKIHRGLAYACGGMHGEDEESCEGYFCERHRGNVIEIPDGGRQSGTRCIAICDACYAFWIDNGGDPDA